MTRVAAHAAGETTLRRGNAAVIFGLLFLLALSAVAAGRGGPVSAARPRAGAVPAPQRTPARPKSLDALIRRLRAGGARVRRAGGVSQPFFSARGRALDVGVGQIQVFEYASARAAEREAALVDPTGSPVGTSMVSWVAPPHFYRSGRLIVLYVGGDAGVIKALEDALGPQFAGG